jgi:hypothetical protein
MRKKLVILAVNITSVSSECEIDDAKGEQRLEKLNRG